MKKQGEDKKLLAMLSLRSASALRGAGYSLSDLIGAGYSASDLRGAGYSASDLRGAGYSASDLIGAGYSASDLRGAGYILSDLIEFESIPIIDTPYTHLWNDIKSKKRIHDQTTFGKIEQYDPKANVCGTRMCTAGHLVNMAGEIGYKLKDKYSWAYAANMIHTRVHPDYMCQDFGLIPQEQAMAYIEEMAAMEQAEDKSPWDYLKYKK